jgi:hypothetical protein
VLALGVVLAGLGQVALNLLGVLGRAAVTVIGTVDLVDHGTSANGCQGVGAYSDVAAGTPVTLTDGTGAVLGTAALGAPLTFGDAGCVYTFRLAHVPTTVDVYSLRVGGTEPVVSSRARMHASGWTTEVHLER